MSHRVTSHLSSTGKRLCCHLIIRQEDSKSFALADPFMVVTGYQKKMANKKQTDV